MFSGRPYLSGIGFLVMTQRDATLCTNTASINASYSVDPRYGFAGQREGILSKSALRLALRADMFRYVVETYIRYGDFQFRVKEQKSPHFLEDRGPVLDS